MTKKSTKSCGYTWCKIANDLISLNATIKLLPTTAKFCAPFIW